MYSSIVALAPRFILKNYISKRETSVQRLFWKFYIYRVLSGTCERSTLSCQMKININCKNNNNLCAFKVYILEAKLLWKTYFVNLTYIYTTLKLKIFFINFTVNKILNLLKSIVKYIFNYFTFK